MPWHRINCSQPGCEEGMRVNGFAQVRSHMNQGWVLLDGARPIARYRLDWDTITGRGWYNYVRWACPTCIDAMPVVVCDECHEQQAYVHSDTDEGDVSRNYFTPHGDNRYCEQCFSSMYRYCEGHGEYTTREGMERGTGGSMFCAECVSSGNFSMCDECGGWAMEDDVIHVEDSDQYECYGCRNGRQERARRSAVEYYSYRPNRFVIRDAKGHRVLSGTPKYRTLQHRGRLFGVELEVEPRSRVDQGVANAVAKQLTEFGEGTTFYCKEDASVGAGGFEVVSHPCTYQWWMTEGKEHMEKMMEVLRDEGFRSHNGGHCGLHIHTNRWPITHLQHYKLAQFIYKEGNFDVLKKISRRGNMDYAMLKINGDPETFAKQVGKQKYGGSRWALNQAADETVELRLFRGTLKIDRFLAAIQFYDALLNYTSNADGTGLDRFDSWNKFAQYAALHSNNYKYLTNEIEEFNLQCV